MRLVDEVERMIGNVGIYLTQFSVEGAQIEVDGVGRMLDEAAERVSNDDYQRARSRYDAFRKSPDVSHFFDYNV